MMLFGDVLLCGCRGPKGKVLFGVTSKSAGKKDVDARPKAGHDEQELF
jgi:hypothetical protein